VQLPLIIIISIPESRLLQSHGNVQANIILNDLMKTALIL